MQIKGLKRTSGESENFGNCGLENHIYFDKHNGIVWCKHETQGQYTLYSNRARFILKSKNHVTMKEIRNAIERELER